VSAEVKAEKKMRAQLIAMGMDPDAKPELSPELAAKLAEDALKSDQDYFFSGALDSGKEIRGKRIKPGDNDFE
jgi:hypothetical protein